MFKFVVTSSEWLCMHETRKIHEIVSLIFILCICLPTGFTVQTERNWVKLKPPQQRTIISPTTSSHLKSTFIHTRCLPQKALLETDGQAHMLIYVRLSALDFLSKYYECSPQCVTKSSIYPTPLRAGLWKMSHVWAQNVTSKFFCLFLFRGAYSLCI